MACNHEKMTSLRPFYGTEDHLYCPECKGHQYGGRWWSKQDWEEWINSEA